VDRELLEEPCTGSPRVRSELRREGSGCVRLGFVLVEEEEPGPTVLSKLRGHSVPKTSWFLAI
jgi:hypothetical protein